MAMSPLTPRLLRAGRWTVTSALDVMRRLDQPRAQQVLTRPAAHPLQPAAIRVERSRGGDNSAQTAVTMWFGEGPALPAPGAGRAAMRGVLSVGAGVLGAAALAALTTVAAQREMRLGDARVRHIGARPVDAEARTAGPG